MKKSNKTLTILQTLGLLAIAGLGNSHSAAAEGKIALGAQGGLTFPNFKVKNNSPANQYSNKNGWLAGVYAEIGLWSITLRPELNYVTKSFTIANVAEVKNHYVEIPLLVKINPLADMVVSPFILFGPQWSKQTSADVTVLGSTTSYTNTADQWDLAGVAGLGLEFNVSEHVGINLQGRYAYGFRNIDSSTTEVKTRCFYALGGLAIAL